MRSQKSLCGAHGINSFTILSVTQSSYVDTGNENFFSLENFID